MRLGKRERQELRKREIARDASKIRAARVQASEGRYASMWHNPMPRSKGHANTCGWFSDNARRIAAANRR